MQGKLILFINYKIMKKQVTILISLFLIFFAAGQSLSAQKASTGKTMTEKEKQEMIQKAEQAAKQAEQDKLKVEELYRQQMIDSEQRKAELNEINESLAFEVMDMANTGAAFTWASPEARVFFSGSSQNSETLEFRKSVTESTFEKKIPFNIEQGTVRASISVSGSCKEGEIRIKILTPGGETYTEVLIDEYGSVNWNKSFSIDEENNSRTGTWNFTVSAKKATGNFRLTIKSN